MFRAGRKRLSESVYSAISASVDTANSVEFVAQANALAVGGFTQTATAVDILTTALNAYQLEGYRLPSLQRRNRTIRPNLH